MKPSTKLEFEKLLNYLSTPKNVKKITKAFALLFIAVFGLCLSASLISTGLVLVKESGVPEYIIKGVAGVTALILGYAVLGISVARPARTLYKIVFE